MRRTAFALFLSVCLFVVAVPVRATALLVTNTADSGPGSLRQAILDSNGHGGVDSINFVFAGTSPITIFTAAALPTITDTVIVDGLSMPGASIAGRPLVEIRNLITGPTNGGITGLDVQAPNCLIRGLIINSFYVGINVGPYAGNSIQGNWVGLEANGVTAAGNNRGIQTESDSSNTHIGGTSATARNVVSGNIGEGIVLAGLCTLPHCGAGKNSTSDVIEGNYIGTDYTGTVAVPNGGSGIWLTSQAVGTLVGGTTLSGSASRNVISANVNEGILIDGSGIIVAYNWIGLDANGAPLGNSSYGVWVFDETGTTISFNKIAYNNIGVVVSGHHTFIYSNSIFSNTGLGISLGGVGPTPNDLGDADTGPNDLQNYPVITTAISEPTQLKITGSINSIANSNYYVSFYSNQVCDPSGFGEGETPLFAGSVNTDATGNATFSFIIPGFVAPGSFITATARDAAVNSSEFSACRQVVEGAPPLITSITPSTGPWGTTVTITGSRFTTVTGVSFFNGNTASFVVNSDTQITATVPSGSLTGAINVVNSYGNTLTPIFTVNNPAPNIKGISPNLGLGGGGTNVTIRGSGFLPGAAVAVGGTASNVAVVNSTTITATTGSHLAGGADVTVTNTDKKESTLRKGFTFYCSPDLSPAITLPRTVPPGSTSNPASVADAGAGATYSWNVSSGAVTSGAGTSAITFGVGTTNVIVSVTVSRPDCSAAQSRTVTVAGTKADFDADGKADLLLQNSITRDVAVWKMNGVAMTTGFLVGTPAASYFVKAVADFDGDGKSDIALQDLTTGDVVVWMMNVGTVVSGSVIARPGPAWHVVGSGDLDGDRKADLVLQNSTTGDVAVWLMNGPVIVNGAMVGSPGSAYSVVGVGDFNGDGRADILLQSTSGDIAEWQMNGLTISSGAAIGNPGTQWLVKGVGDVNGDNMADILLRNSNSGDIAEWQMNGVAIIAGSNMGGPGVGFDLIGSCDFDGDGNADVLLRDASGNLAIWLLNGGTIRSAALVAPSPGPDFVPIVK